MSCLTNEIDPSSNSVSRTATQVVGSSLVFSMTIEKSRFMVRTPSALSSFSIRLFAASEHQRFPLLEDDQPRWLRVRHRASDARARTSHLSFASRRVYLASKKSDEHQTKYAIKVINKNDIRKKNLIDQSTRRNVRAASISLFLYRQFSTNGTPWPACTVHSLFVCHIPSRPRSTSTWSWST